MDLNGLPADYATATVLLYILREIKK